jgi:hypothetical protein
VIEVRTDVPLTPDIQPDDLIIKAEYAEFLGATRIMELRPNVDLSVTIPGQYEKLMEQICVQESLLEGERKSQISFQEAVQDWYDNIYIPLAETIRDRGLLRWFLTAPSLIYLYGFRRIAPSWRKSWDGRSNRI